ncbi:hypothetical protein [Amycolatopsis methanolica]|uniref:hypothetical protein n=1 Tax=Amycolatopsis methanolica TaxID=1814 RepID=UPI00341E1590
MDEQSLLRTLTKVVTTLTAREIPFTVSGGCAVYARGGPPSDHDVDVFLKEEDVLAARRGGHAAGRPAGGPRR